MKQIVHIFLKDVRHLWIEILVALAMIVAQLWTGRYQWTVEGPTGGYEPVDILHTASILLVPLMLIAWVLLIARCVHDDRLVGDRQFWLTRPYEWWKLLAAKFLFVAAFIIIPFLALQCVLLAQAGFSPLHWMPQILIRLLLIVAAIILPLMAIATVTSGFGRMVLVLIGVLLYTVIGFVSSAIQGRGSVTSLTTPVRIGDYVSDLLFLLVCGTVVFLQYQRHHVVLSRLLLAGVFVVACAVDFIGPDRLLIDHNYPAMNSESIAPLNISVNNQSGGYERDITTLQRRRQSISLRVAGIVPGSAMRIDGAKASFETQDGFRWASGWQAQNDNGILSDTEMTSIEDTAQAGVHFTMPEAVYERLKGASNTLTLTVALTQLKAGSTTEFMLPQPMQDVNVPGFGICVPQPGFSVDARALACRFPYQAPLTLVSVQWFDQRCAQVQSEPGIKGSGWAGSLSHRAPQAVFAPVQWPAFPLSNNGRIMHGREVERNLCPGTPVSFTPYNLVRRVQTNVTASNFHFPADPKFGMNERPEQLRAQAISAAGGRP